MVKRDKSDVVKEKVKKYSEGQIAFTKSRILDWLCKRNKTTVEKMKEEVLNLKDLTFTERQLVEFEGEKEERFRCYFVYSNNRGRCYVLKFDKQIKIITVFPLGRTTLKRYRKSFK
tara:strand:+ start:12 stop:359 length:348 start_codon:yes stop_codon:yes gene_type:complete